MGSGKVHAIALVNHASLQQFRQLHQQSNAGRSAGGPVGHDDGLIGLHQQLGGLLYGARITLRG